MGLAARKIKFLPAIVLMALLIVLGLGVVDVHAASVNNATGYVNARFGVNVRSGAGTRYRIAFGLRDNTKVTITQEVFTTLSSTSSVNKWYQVSYGGRTGYIRSDLIDGISYTTVNGSTTTALNYRTGAGTGMTRLGTLATGKTLAVVLKAKPYNSNTTWYKVKIGSSYRYVCGTFVDITGSIFTKPSTPLSGSGSGGSGTNSGSSGSSSGGGSGTASGSFEDQLSAQGFPEDYKVYLRKLHQEHPNWVFQSIKTGLDFNTVVGKESSNSVSLVNAAYPLSYRSTASGDFKAGSGRDVYSSTSTSSGKVGHVANSETFTILDEKFTSNSTASSAKWVHVKLSNGITGYINGAVTSGSYGSSIKAIAQKNTNIRTIAGTASGSYVRTLTADTSIDVVLAARDSSGRVWYKFRDGSTYRYICGDYVKLQPTEIQQGDSGQEQEQASSGQDQSQSQATTGTAVTGKTNTALNYRKGPGVNFPKVGMFNSGQTVTVLASVTSADNNTWYKINNNGDVVYVLSTYVDVSGTVTAGTAAVPGTVNSPLNYRSEAGTGATRLGTFGKGTAVTITGAKKSGSYVWYRATYNGKDIYLASDWVTLGTEKADTSQQAAGTTASSTTTSSSQASAGASASTTTTTTDVSKLTGAGSIVEGTYIPKDGSSWYSANSQTVAYFVDPRNFLNEDRVYMFEYLGYNSSYQTVQVVNKILSGTALQRDGYQASWFVSAGAKYGISPVSLAARARQETGGGSIAESGYTIGGVTYYNPFNIGAYTSSNPVLLGMQYAKKQGWSSKQAAINGAASFLASGYINNRQNTIYLERFNVANGASKVATHQYMTNIMAPYSEALSTKNAYATYGITNESLVFLIPVYDNMPASTSLPS